MKRSTSPVPNDPDGEQPQDAGDTFAGLLLALVGGRRVVVLCGGTDGDRLELLGRLARRLEQDGLLVMTVGATSGVTVEDLIEVAGRSRLGATAPDTDFETIVARIERHLDAEGGGVLMVENAGVLSSETICDLFDLSGTPTPGGHALQIVLSGGSGLDARIGAPELDAARRQTAATFMLDVPPLPADAPPPSRPQDLRRMVSAQRPPPPAHRRGTQDKRRGSRLGGVVVVGSLLGLAALATALFILARNPFDTEAPTNVALSGTVQPDLRTPPPEPPTATVRTDPDPEALTSPVGPPPAAESVAPRPDEARPLPAIPAQDRPPDPTPAALPTPLVGQAAGTDRRVQADLERQILALLSLAEAQIDRRNLTTPNGDNALETLRALAAIAPGNTAIGSLRARILETYRVWARQAERRGEWDFARAYYQRALRVDPADPEMTRLLDGIDQRRRGNRPASAAVQASPPPARDPAPPVPTLKP